MRQLAAALLSFGAVALVSGAIYALEPVAPVLSLGVLYLFAVLPVAAIWGLPYALPVSIVSMLAFNFFFLPPKHTLRLADSENWVALAVYLVTAISVSGLAARARRRGAEAEQRRREAISQQTSRASCSKAARSIPSCRRSPRWPRACSALGAAASSSSLHASAAGANRCTTCSRGIAESAGSSSAPGCNLNGRRPHVSARCSPRFWQQPSSASSLLATHARARLAVGATPSKPRRCAEATP
jgi:Domain of unknown function (DUF4118)